VDLLDEWGLRAVAAQGGDDERHANNDTAYQQATALKAEALSLMDKATDQYSLHKDEVETIRVEMEKAYDFAKDRSHNELSAKQWEIVRNPDRNSLAGFLKRWEAAGALSATFVSDAKKVVSDQLDRISEFERGKVNAAH
jgi:hypothetical protein